MILHICMLNTSCHHFIQPNRRKQGGWDGSSAGYTARKGWFSCWFNREGKGWFKGRLYRDLGMVQLPVKKSEGGMIQLPVIQGGRDGSTAGCTGREGWINCRLYKNLGMIQLPVIKGGRDGSTACYAGREEWFNCRLLREGGMVQLSVI